MRFNDSKIVLNCNQHFICNSFDYFEFKNGIGIDKKSAKNRVESLESIIRISIRLADDLVIFRN